MENKKTEKFFESTPPRLKFFKERAERINRTEYDHVVDELTAKSGSLFGKIQPTEQLLDKDSFGDIDIVCLPLTEVNKGAFERIFGENLKGYNKTSHVYSLLVSLASGKEVQVDFIQSKDDADFERKRMYYSKGNFSSIIGMMAKKLHFKYGTDGFFKRFKDRRGNWHDIPVSESLRDGLTALGFNAGAYEQIHTLDDIVAYVKTSPLFDASYYQFDNIVRRDKEAIKRSAREEYLFTQLGQATKGQVAEDEDEFFKKLFPEAFKKFQDEAERINKELYAAGAINGEIIMRTFEISPGPQVGKVLKFLSNQYPEAVELTEEMIERIKNEILK